MNLLNRGQTTRFLKPNTSLTIPKKSQNIAQINLQHQIFAEKEKKKTSKKRKKTIEDYGRKTANLFLAYAYASASSLFVEKLWKGTAVCLKTVEEITKGERGESCRGKLKE